MFESYIGVIKKAYELLDREPAEFRVESPAPGAVDIIFSSGSIRELWFLDSVLDKSVRPLTDKVRVIVEL